MELAQNPFTKFDLSRISKAKRTKGDVILEIVKLQGEQVGCYLMKDGVKSETPETRMPKNLFFILLAPYDLDQLDTIKKACAEKVRNNYSVAAYIKHLRKTIDTSS